MFYHMVQSFPAGEQVDPAAAHAAALKLAEYFEGREVLVSTHVDRDHIHSHFLINSVSFENGKKLHISEPELTELRQRNDQVCMEFSLPAFQPQKKKQNKAMSGAEYHVAAKRESWKFQLMNTIDECMRFAHDRQEFIALMRSEGCDVRWTDSRKNITYTVPGGKRCRDDRLHDEKYLKENMENEFRIREELINGRIAPAEYAADNTAPGMASNGGRMGEPAGLDHRSASAGEGTKRSPRPTEISGTATAGKDIDAGRGSYSGAAPTGWEKERAALFNPAYQPAAPQLGVADGSGGAGGIGSAVVQLGYNLERLGDVAPAYAPQSHTDRKTRQKEREKKIAHGHAEDDHEDYQGMTQTM